MKGREKRMKELLSDYEGLIKHIANDWKRHEAELDDLIQAGRIGLWKAMEVDPNGTPGFYKQKIRWHICNEAKRLGMEPIHESLDTIDTMDMHTRDFV